jgi:hypothetical protein
MTHASQQFRSSDAVFHPLNISIGPQGAAF